MDRHAVSNTWRLFNLQESPFFQEPLQAGTRYPMSLFVARAADSDRLLAKIARSPASSRQTIRGPVGVGKSTLAQHIKAEVAKDGILSTPAAVSVGSALTADQLCALVLRSVLDACMGKVAQKKSARKRFENSSVVRQTSQLVRIYQAVTGKAGGASAAGFGANVSKTRTLVTPSTATPTLVIQSILQDLLSLVREHLGARSILVHFNNLENLSESDASRAAAIMRDVRDLCFMVEGYHWLVVGTSEAVRTVIDAQPQLATVFFTPPALQPLSAEELLELLSRRYEALRVDQKHAARPPVETQAVTALYKIFNGDLRGTFAALDDATGELLGLGAEGPEAPLSFDDMKPFLSRWYAQRAAECLGSEAAANLIKLARRQAGRPFTASAIRGDILKTRNQQTIRRFIDDLLRYGYIKQHHERLQRGGRPAVQYQLAGAAKLAASFFEDK